MTFSNSDNARNTLKYTGQNYQFTPAYARNRDPTIHDIKDPKNQGYYPYTALWINKTNDNLWALVKIANNLATWILLSGGGAQTLRVQVDATTAPGVNPVTPDGTGLLTITGAQVATGTIGGNVLRTHTVALNQFTIEIQRSTAVAATDITKNGVSHFNSAQFTVDANAFVGLVGGTGPAIQSLTGDDALPVVPTAGNINLTGITVASATHAKPLFFVKNAVSTEELDIQLSTAITAPANSNLAGISSFDTASFAVNANGWVTSKSGITPGISNIAFTYSAGTFTVTSANGTALSATNPGYVTISHPSAFDQMITITITTPYTFTDAAGTNEIGANNWDTTAGTAWANDRPFYLYANINSAANDIAFAICPIPNSSVAPAAGNYAVAGTTVTSTQGGFFGLKKAGVTPTVANFAAQPCLLLGSFRMTKSAGNAWTVSALASTDGIQRFNENFVFTYPVNHHLASGNTHFVQDANAPVWSGKLSQYSITRLGAVTYNILYTNLTANGTTGVLWKPTTPYTGFNGSNSTIGWYQTITINKSLIAATWNGTPSNFEVIAQGFLNSLSEGDITGTSVQSQFSFTLQFNTLVG